MTAKFSVMTRDLHEATKLLKAVMPPKSKRAFWVSTHARIDTRGDHITLSVFNFDDASDVYVDVGADIHQPGGASVNVRDLCEMLATYPVNMRADFEFDETSAILKMRADACIIRYKAHLASEFPVPYAIPVLSPVTLSQYGPYGAGLRIQTSGEQRAYLLSDFGKLKLPVLKASAVAFDDAQDCAWFRVVHTFKASASYRVGRKLITPPKARIYATYLKRDIQAIARPALSFERAAAFDPRQPVYAAAGD